MNTEALLNKTPSADDEVVSDVPREDKARALKPAPSNIAELSEEIERAVPGLSMILEPGGDVAGNWWITMQLATHVLVIEWRPLQGYGVYALDEEGYGVGPEFVFADAAAAAGSAVGTLRGVQARLNLGEPLEPAIT